MNNGNNKTNTNKHYVNNDVFFTYKKLIRDTKYTQDLGKLLNYLNITELKKKDNLVIFDIGSNVGVYTLLFTKTFKNIKQIYSFEPHLKTFNIMNDNITLNNLNHKVSQFNIGFSDKKGNYKIGFPSNDLLKENSITVNDNTNTDKDTEFYSLFGKENTEDIFCDTLDNFVKEHNINKLDFIKIDVEGSEFNVLKGGKNTLKTLKPVVVFEFNKLTKNLSGLNSDDLYKFLKELNYKMYGFEYNFFINPNELKDLNVNNVSDILCIPNK